MRKTGHSITDISKKYGIAKSTLSGWLKDVKITKIQRDKMLNNRNKALSKARKKAVIWHNNQKLEKVRKAKKEAYNVVQKIDTNDESILELALAMLYWGEGYKNKASGIGSSDPDMLNFFLDSIKLLYNIDRSQIRYDLNLRADQDIEKTKDYWSNALKIPVDNIKYCSIDKRTTKTKTYSWYKGVCQINISKIAIQRRLLFVYKLYCDKISN